MRTAPRQALECRLQGRGRDLAGFARKRDQFEPAAEEFRSAAFVGREMTFLMAQHGSPGRRDVRQRQRVRGGSGRHQERRELVLEDFGQASLQPFRDRILAVAEREAVVGAADRREDRGRDPGGIVAGEMHTSLPSCPGAAQHEVVRC